MKNKNGATIHDVAALAGVSISTVSRYLSDMGNVSAYTAYNIRNAIRELDYQPNVFAQNLRKNVSNIIGVITPSANYYFAESYRAISDYFYLKGYMTYLCHSDNDAEKEQFFIQGLVNQKAAGLVVISCGSNTEFLSKIVNNYDQTCMIILDRPEDVGCDIVTEDHEENAYLLTSHVLRHLSGNRPVVMMFGTEKASSTQKIVCGMRKAFEEDPSSPREKQMFLNCQTSDALKSAVTCVSDYIKKGMRPQIIAFGPNLLETAVRELHRLAISVRDKHVDVAGFALPDSMDWLGISFPSVIQNPDYSGIVAAEVLYKHIQGKSKTDNPQTYKINVKLNLT